MNFPKSSSENVRTHFSTDLSHSPFTLSISSTSSSSSIFISLRRLVSDANFAANKENPLAACRDCIQNLKDEPRLPHFKPFYALSLFMRVIGHLGKLRAERF